MTEAPSASVDPVAVTNKESSVWATLGDNETLGVVGGVLTSRLKALIVVKQVPSVTVSVIK